MEFKGDGLEAHVNVAEQSDEWLIRAAQDIADIARIRGLRLPSATGSVAVEGAIKSNIVDSYNELNFIKESITNQLKPASEGYRSTMYGLHLLGYESKKFKLADSKLIKAEFEDWLSIDKLATVIAIKETNPTAKFTLVITPNIIVDTKNIIHAAKIFGHNISYPTNNNDTLLNQYTSEQLSGTNPTNGNIVKFSLVENDFDSNLYGTVEEQRINLAKMQTSSPDIKVPSVLDSLAYWNTLLIQPEKYQDRYTLFNRTYIRHFDLPEKYTDDVLGVPRSVLNPKRLGNILESPATINEKARISIG
ncbi:MAG: hypothetical protein NVSMB46_03360 [Candidatus Saccharimonadales bacterium]